MSGDLIPDSKALMPVVTSRWPTHTLDDILEACDPGEALLPDDSQRVDMESLRHGRGIQKFQRAFQLNAPRGGFHHGLLCGHRGSGKSTELLRLKDWAGRNGFLAVSEQVDVHFGMIELDYSDLFLMAATMSERGLKDHGYPLPEEKVRRVMMWKQERTASDLRQSGQVRPGADRQSAGTQQPPDAADVRAHDLHLSDFAGLQSDLRTGDRRLQPLRHPANGAIRRKDNAWSETVLQSSFDSGAIQSLRRLLAERIDLDRVFAHQEDVDTLIKMSGGSIRDLIQMTASAATFTEEDVITTEAVQDAVNELRGTYMRLMANTPHDYRCLAIHARREPMSTVEGDQSATLSRLIFRGCLLEYMEEEKPWYDVHPALIDTEEMRHARSATTRTG